MKISYSDEQDSGKIDYITTTQELLVLINNLDNEKRENINLYGSDKEVFSIIGPNKNRVVISFTRLDNEQHQSSHLVDPELKMSNDILDIGYRGGADSVEIYYTVPLEIAKAVATHYFEHKKIANHGQYVWEGDIEPD